jgi:serine/threonine protein kinase/Flp pilus assembly protein TadD
MPKPQPELAAALSDRYAIEREIGEGGMATVYLARDLKHDRAVAVKVLRRELTAAVGAERFLREIRITASLDHPRILTLIDSGEAAGFLYCVLPFVRGESVRQRLDREGQLPVDEALAIARQMAAALDFAHRRGVVHRDIKPENILLQEGEALLVDFGVALAAQEARVGRLTMEGTWLGSPVYMSPEQVTGDHQVDARSDVYALAAVLYEMLAGEPPYSARSVQALVAKRLVDPVPSVRRLRPSVPAAVDRALLRALAPAPADRFASARDFADALGAREPDGDARSSVAVLPFLSLSSEPDNEFFADGVTEDLIAHLAKIRDLRVLARASVMPFKDRRQGLREIAAQLQTNRLVDGSVRRVGDRVRIVAQLVDAANDRQLWSETYDRQLTDIFAIQTDVALSIANALEARLSPDERTRIRREPTSDMQAYGLYQQGRHWLLRFTVDALRRAIGYFEQAIERDPLYALPHVGICLAHIELTEMGAEEPDLGHPTAKAAVARALELDECLGEAHCMSAYLSALADYDWARAEGGFRRALELSPSSADTWDLYGRMCSALRRFDEAVEMVRRAETLDPLAHRNDVANALLRAGRHEEALEAARANVALDPGYDRARATLGWALIETGSPAQGMAELELAVELAAGNRQWLAQLGQAYGRFGQADRARAILAELEELAKRSYVSPYHFVFVHVGLGEHDRALDILERAIEDRAAAAYGVDGSFLLAPLRSHPRYEALREKLRLPGVAAAAAR